MLFTDFAAHAARHGLQYLAEADFFETQTGVVPEAAADALLAVEDPIRREQYLDFLKVRMFRQTLLCRAGPTVDRTPRADRLEPLAVSSPARRREDAAAPSGTVAFAGPTGSTLTTDHPGVVAALDRIPEAWPAAVLDGGRDRAALATELRAPTRPGPGGSAGSSPTP